MVYGGIEAGGTKWVSAIGSGPEDIIETVIFPTGKPEETIARAVEFFARNGPVAAVGIGSFGPIDIRHESATWGHITTTPKPGWGDIDIASALRAALDVPIALDTDVNAAALAEHRWGAAQGLDTFFYVTVGTGIGGGGMANGELLHGLMHPEFGHIRVPHDREDDPFEGVCPYHGDCLEGLASGEAIRVRRGSAGEAGSDLRIWELEAGYLAAGLTNLICTLSPQRIVLGGGVMKEPRLLPLVRENVRGLLAGYIRAPELGGDLQDYLTVPALGDRAGVLGSLELARRLL